MPKNNQANFIRLAEARTTKALTMIRRIGNLCDSTNYNYTEGQVASIFIALKDEMDIQKKRFKHSTVRGETIFTLNHERDKKIKLHEKNPLI